MKTSHFGASVSAVVAASAAGILLAVQFVGCGGDDTTGGSSDASQPPPDTSVTQDGNGGLPDSSTDAPIVTEDAEASTTAPDADAGVDGGSNDAAVACTIAVPTAADFNTTLSDTVCQSLKACCGTGAQFDTAKCLATYSGPAGGGWMGSGYVIPYQDSGRVAYDTSAACQCLEGNATINCGLVPLQTWNSIKASCVGAVHGSVPPQIPSEAGAADAGDAGSSACASSYECAQGAYCTVQNASDPGPSALGTCLPLVPDGGACTSDFDCSYLSNGTPPLYCGQSNTCVPRFDAGAACQTNANCALNDCTSFTCQSGLLFSDHVGSGGICDYFTLPDGG